MSGLPDIPPMPPEAKEFRPWFYWFKPQWQKALSALYATDARQDETIADIQDTQADLSAAVETITEQGIELEDAVDLLNATIGIVDGNTDDLGTVGDRLDAIESAATYAATGIDIVSGGVLKVNHVQVVGPQGAAVADAVAAVGVPTQAEFNAFVTQFNTWLARARAHGAIAS